MPRTPATARKATAAKTAAAAKRAPAKTAAAKPTVAEQVAADLDPTPTKPTRAPAAAAPSSPVGAYVEIAIDAIDDSPDNPRTVLTDLPSLARSIEAHGVIEPVIVVQDGDRFRIVAGHRRVAAAKLAALKSVPAILRTDDAVAEHIHRMVENLQRVDLNPVEEARGYARLKDLGVKQKAIAEAVGRNQGHVSKRLTLLSLPEPLQARVGRPEEVGGVTLEQAVDIARLPGRVQIAIAEASHADDDAKWKGGWDLENLIRREAQVAERASELVDVVKALRASKVTVLNLAGDEISEPPSTSGTDGPAPLSWLPAYRGPQGADTHMSLPCHAVIVRRSPVGGESLLERWTQEVCTDPASHAGSPAEADAIAAGAAPRSTGVGSALADPAAAAEREAKVAAVDAAKAQLHRFVADLVHGKVVREMSAYVLRGQVRDALLGREYYLANAADAAALVDRAEAGGLIELLRFGVSGSGDKLVRAALTGRLEADLDAVGSWLRDFALGYAGDVRLAVDAIAFFDFAVGLGYEPGELERAALEAVGSHDSVLVEALQEADLIDGDGSISGAATGPNGELLDEPRDWSEARRAAGVTDDAIARATVDGVADDVWLEPGRQIPTGRCATCGGAARALLSGAGRHAPGGGSVRKGAAACPGKDLLTISDVEAADATVAARIANQVACPDCGAVGRDADDGLCTRCNGSGLIPGPDAEPIAVAG